MRGLVVAVTVVAACGHVDFDGIRMLGDGAGSGDGSASDGSQDCSALYELCDGFEGTSFAAVWMVTSNVTIDTTVAHRGASSMHAQTPIVPIGTNSYRQLRQTTTLALDDPTFYVRAWVRISAMPVVNMSFIAVEQSGGPDNEDAFVLRPTDLAIYSQFANNSNGNGTRPPLDTWFCVLWTVHRDTGNAGSIMLGGDEPPAPPLNNLQTDAASPIAIMDFGIAFAGSVVTQQQPAMDVWVDDVIVSSFAVTCAD